MKSVLASNTPSGITTKIKHMVRPTPLAADAKLSSHHIPQGFNVFQYIFCVMNNLPKPNLYHTMQIHILHPPHKWTIHLMKLHTWLDKYNAIWLSIPPYLNLIQSHISYEEVSQWNRKVMNEISRYLVGVATQTLWGGSPAQGPIINPTIERTSASYNSICVLNIHLTRMQHLAPWRTPCAVFTPSKMLSNSGEPANI
jgi:hypothetical protein